MAWQISDELVPSCVIGIVLFSVSIYITMKTISLNKNNISKMLWILIEALIIFFLVAYGVSIYLTLANNVMLIVSIAGYIYLVGAIFIFLVISVSHYVLKENLKENDRAERTLVQLNTELEQKVEERTNSLKDAQEKIMQQEKFAAIGKLAGNVAHELRNPLGIITNSVHFLGLKIPATDEKIGKHLKLIREQSDRANQIIMDLLDFAKTKPTEARLVDVKALIEETVDQIPRPEAIKIKTSIDADLPTILLDPGKMKQAFQNILINAEQAMPDGGLLTITATKKEGMIKIAFNDTGVGITSENLPKIFEPLFSTKAKGIGLGLVIVKEIVEYHEGTVTVESEVGVGSTFTIKLPIREKKIAFTKLSTSFW
jgi:signal transduction histidine kinase